MKRTGSPRVEGYAALAALGLLAALVLRRPELAVLAAPFALCLVVGTALARDPRVTAELTLEHERTLEDAEVEATITVRSHSAVDRLELRLDLPPGVELVEGSDARALRLGRRDEREIPLLVRCTRRGAYRLGDIELRARDLFRLVVWEGQEVGEQHLKAYPRPLAVSRVLRPAETQAFVGSELARVKGDGIEYADIRDFLPGDRVRSINWRASARRQTLVVNERHPERNTDVVLFIDSFLDVEGGGRSALDDAVRAAATLAIHYLERRDRVGLVGFGGVLRWLEPGLGNVQRFRLIETMLETGVQPTYTWRDVKVIPARILPPKALVLAVTPLVDERFIAALEDLRARKYDVAVVEVDPVPIVAPGPSEVDRLAYRLWILEREAQRARLQHLGIGVASWPGGELDPALEEVRTFRRYANVVRA